MCSSSGRVRVRAVSGHVCGHLMTLPARASLAARCALSTPVAKGLGPHARPVRRLRHTNRRKGDDARLAPSRPPPAHTVCPLARPFWTRADASPPARSRQSALFLAGSAHGCLAGGLGINLGLAQWILYVVNCRRYLSRACKR